MCIHVYVYYKKNEKFVCMYDFDFLKILRRFNEQFFSNGLTHAGDWITNDASLLHARPTLNVKWMRVLERDEEKRHSRVTIEITSRVIVVAAHNSSGNSGNGGGTYVASCC